MTQQERQELLTSAVHQLQGEDNVGYSRIQELVKQAYIQGYGFEEGSLAEAIVVHLLSNNNYAISSEKLFGVLKPRFRKLTTKMLYLTIADMTRNSHLLISEDMEISLARY